MRACAGQPLSAVPVAPTKHHTPFSKLQKKGITQQELEAKLLEKGIDLTTVDPTDPAQVTKAKLDIEEAIAELESEKNKGSFVRKLE